MNRNGIAGGDCLLEPVVGGNDFDTGPQLFGACGEKFVDDDSTGIERFARTKLHILLNGAHHSKQSHNLCNCERNNCQQQKLAAETGAEFHRK